MNQTIFCWIPNFIKGLIKILVVLTLLLNRKIYYRNYYYLLFILKYQ